MYEDTQIGKSPIVLGVVAAIAARAWSTIWGAPFVAFLPPLLIVGAVVAVFSTLTIRIGKDTFECWLCLPLIRKSVALKDVRFARSRKVAGVGFGIHFDFQGNASWIVSGGDAIEFVFDNGKRWAVGCNDAKRALQSLAARGVQSAP